MIGWTHITFQGSPSIKPSDKMLGKAAWHLGSPHRKAADKSLSGSVLSLGNPETAPSKGILTQAALTLRYSRASRWAKSLAGFLLRTQHKQPAPPENAGQPLSKGDSQADSPPTVDTGYIQNCIELANQVGSLLEPPVAVTDPDLSSTGSKAYNEFHRLDTVWHAQRVAQELAPFETVSVPTTLSASDAYREFARLDRLCSTKFTPDERARHLEAAYRKRFPDYKPHPPGKNADYHKKWAS